MNTNQRRTLVNLSVIAGSAAMFATAWTGIVRADGNRSEEASVPVTKAMAVASVHTTSPPVLNAAPSVGDSQAPSPTPAPRRIVIVRQSRAS